MKFNLIMMLSIVFGSILIHLTHSSTPINQPNIVFILTDDEDAMLLGPEIKEYDIMPNRHKIFAKNGIHFKNAFASSPTCCVSRSSILTGKYVHNHNVVNNTIDGNCFSMEFREKHEIYSYANYLNQVGYRTFFAGKYLNEYGMLDDVGDSCFDIPSGWTDWYALAGEIVYYNWCSSNMGTELCYGHDASDYHTKVIKNQAIEFLKSVQEENEQNDDDQRTPFLLVFSTVAAHSPWTVAAEYEEADIGKIAPRTKNWNVVNERLHHRLLTAQVEMDDITISGSDSIYQWRLSTLRTVDDSIGEIYDFIKDEMAQIDNTYFIYTSDHGFHNGQWGMAFSKMNLYETDIRVPFFMNGPYLKTGHESAIFATTIDIAPTILDLAGIELNDLNIITEGYATHKNEMDGKSLLPYALKGGDDETSSKFQAFLIDYRGMANAYDEFYSIPSNIDWIDDVVADGWNNTYACLRWINSESGQNMKYCLFTCYGPGKTKEKCTEGSVESQGEFYDLNQDPWETENNWHKLTDAQHTALAGRIKQFKGCVGEQCRVLYTKKFEIIYDDDVDEQQEEQQEKEEKETKKDTTDLYDYFGLILKSLL